MDLYRCLRYGQIARLSNERTATSPYFRFRGYSDRRKVKAGDAYRVTKAQAIAACGPIKRECERSSKPGKKVKRRKRVRGKVGRKRRSCRETAFRHPPFSRGKTTKSAKREREPGGKEGRAARYSSKTRIFSRFSGENFKCRDIPDAGEGHERFPCQVCAGTNWWIECLSIGEKKNLWCAREEKARGKSGIFPTERIGNPY